MDLNDTFNFGQYKGLSLVQVYQGTKSINSDLIVDFLGYCTKFPAYNISLPQQFEFCDVEIGDGKLKIQPQIFDETKPLTPNNVVHLGNVSTELDRYFNHYFDIDYTSHIYTLIKFNSLHVRNALGGDPAYIEWCHRESIIQIGQNTKIELERLIVNQLIGITFNSVILNEYTFTLDFKEYFHKLKI